MNKYENEPIHKTVAAVRNSSSIPTKSAKRARRMRDRNMGRSVEAAIGQLPREAERLLAVLEQADTRIFCDPTDEAGVIVHRKRAGISVGAGRFAIAHAEALVRQDLACWQRSETGQKVLCLSEAGRAHMRRLACPDSEAAFLHQHRETALVNVQIDMGTKRVRIDAEESPLDWLRRRKDRNGEPLIDEAAYQAGERLRTDIMLAGLLPGVTARWDAMPKSGGAGSPSEATDRMIAARQRIRNAFDAVGADFSDLLMDLCGFLKGLELIERERRWPARSAKIVVRLALARLAEHYGIEAKARGPAASRGIRSWQAVVIEGGRG